jgi:histidine ammonia-lyase
MTVEVTGSTLTLDEVVRVARGGERVALAESARERMRASRRVLEEALASGARVYGLTTGVGMRRDATVSGDEAAAFNRSAIAGHLVGLGPPAEAEVVRAALLSLANSIAAGHHGARPEIAQALVDALNGGRLPTVHSLGTLGQGDLAQSADLARGVLDEVELEAGEALALLAASPFATGQAALAVTDARTFVETADVAAALDFEALRANVGALHEAVGKARPYPGIVETLERLRGLLAGSALWSPGAARFLQDPLTFRCVPQVHGAARDALRFVEGQLAIELNAHQGNPLVVEDERTIVSVGNFDTQPLATALDLARLALAPVVTACVERALKLLSPGFSGLSEGLAGRGDAWEDGLSELGVAGQAVAAEARLLAQPVSYELASTTQESGVEDRATLASLAARRLEEMLALGRRVLAVELVVAAQAVDLRGDLELGSGVATAHAFVRERVPFVSSPSVMPLPLEELASGLRAGVAGT